MNAIVWSKENCQFCSKAIALLQDRGFQIEVKKVGQDYTKEDLLAVIPTAKSVPQITINDQYIGGYNQLVAWLEHFQGNNHAD